MSHFSKLVAAHPLSGKPYDMLEFVEFHHNGVPLYSVMGGGDVPRAARHALQRAFELYGGKCFYCPTKFEPQSLSNGASSAHRDHVIASSQGGSDLLHNLVIACERCGTTKADDPIHDFRPKSAKLYLEALNKHLVKCLKAQAATANPSSPPPPKRAAAAGP